MKPLMFILGIFAAAALCAVIAGKRSDDIVRKDIYRKYRS